MSEKSALKFLLVTPIHKSQGLQEQFLRHFPQAQIFLFPSVKLAYKAEAQSLIHQSLDSADYLVFSSSFAAQFFVDNLNHKALRAFSQTIKLKLISVGPSVSQILNQLKTKWPQIQILESTIFSIDGITELLEQENRQEELNNKQIIFISGDKSLASKAFERLKLLGAKIEALEIYESIINNTPDYDSLKTFTESSFTNNTETNIICFTSPQTVINFCKLLQTNLLQHNNNWIAASIGPSTTDCLKQFLPEIRLYQAQPYTYEGLIELCKQISRDN